MQTPNLSIGLCAVLVTLTTICPQKVLAFLNIESLRQSTKTGFYGASGVKASGASGNTEKNISNLSSRNIYRQDGKEALLILSHSYGEVRGKKDTNNGHIHIRYSQFFSENLAWESFGQVEFNEFTALNLRHLLGGGVRWRLVKREKNSLHAGVGAFYEVEDLKIDPEQRNWRGNIYLSYRSLLDEAVEIVGVAYYQPSLARNNDYRFQLDLGFEVPLVRNFTLTVELNAAYDSRPPTGVNKKDIVYLTGLTYKY